MKPSAAPIECRSYFVTELRLNANETFAPEKPMELNTSDLLIDSKIMEPAAGQILWGISLSIQQTVQPGKNAPYSFAIKLWGTFEPRISLPEDKKRQMLLTTGSSILYGAAREVVRDLTARGPFSSLLLPTVSFHPRPEEKPIEQAIV